MTDTTTTPAWAIACEAWLKTFVAEENAPTNFMQWCFRAGYEAASARSEPLGKWMSAALDDPLVCDEMKADIRRWFDDGCPRPVGGDHKALIEEDVPTAGEVSGMADWLEKLGHPTAYKLRQWADYLSDQDATK